MQKVVGWFDQCQLCLCGHDQGVGADSVSPVDSP